MCKYIFVATLLIHLVIAVKSRRMDVESLENEESESIEVPIRNRPNSPKFSIFKKADDPVFNFVSGLLNTINKSTKMTVSRAKNMNEKRKELDNEIDKFLQTLPSFHIPILDDITPVINNTI